MMGEPIKWDDFENRYWSPEKDIGYNLVLTNWRQEKRSYDDGKTEKNVLVFDIIKLDNVELAAKPLQFVTSAASFATPVRPIIEAATARAETVIEIYLEYSKDKKYRVLDMNKVKDVYMKSVVKDVEEEAR